MICDHIEECKFLNKILLNNPQQTHIVMEKFCKNEPKRCARYLIQKVLGEKSVPEKLFPDMQHVAVQIIKQAENLQNKKNVKSNPVIENIKAEDIFDFVLDLITESTDQVSEVAYKIKDPALRKFTLWINNELQIHYSNMLQLKLSCTGVRGRKRGKNPLMIFIENIRRGKNRANYIYNIKNEDNVCELFFSSFKLRIALLKGLKTKKISKEIITSINKVLEMEMAKEGIDNRSLTTMYYAQHS